MRKRFSLSTLAATTAIAMTGCGGSGGTNPTIFVDPPNSSQAIQFGTAIKQANTFAANPYLGKVGLGNVLGYQPDPTAPGALQGLVFYDYSPRNLNGIINNKPQEVGAVNDYAIVQSFNASGSINDVKVGAFYTGQPGDAEPSKAWQQAWVDLAAAFGFAINGVRAEVAFRNITPRLDVVQELRKTPVVRGNLNDHLRRAYQLAIESPNMVFAGQNVRVKYDLPGQGMAQRTRRPPTNNLGLAA